MDTAAVAKNISEALWRDPQGRLRCFASSRAYGVVDAAGRMLSMDGESPATWRTMTTAKVIAQYLPPKATWIEPVR